MFVYLLFTFLIKLTKVYFQRENQESVENTPVCPAVVVHTVLNPENEQSCLQSPTLHPGPPGGLGVGVNSHYMATKSKGTH